VLVYVVVWTDVVWCVGWCVVVWRGVVCYGVACYSVVWRGVVSRDKLTLLQAKPQAVCTQASTPNSSHKSARETSDSPEVAAGQ
jgi:hypothetical protein